MIAWVTCPTPLPTCWPSTWRKAGTWLSEIAVVSPTFQLISSEIHMALFADFSLAAVGFFSYVWCNKSLIYIPCPGQNTQQLGLSTLGTQGRELLLLPAVQLQSTFLAGFGICTYSGIAESLTLRNSELKESPKTRKKKKRPKSMLKSIKWGSCTKSAFARSYLQRFY